MTFGTSLVLVYITLLIHSVMPLALKVKNGMAAAVSPLLLLF